MLGEVPGATACQGSSLEDGCLQKNKIYFKKKGGTPLHLVAMFLFSSFYYYASVKFININELNLYNPHAPSARLAHLSLYLISFFLFYFTLFFFSS